MHRIDGPGHRANRFVDAGAHDAAGTVVTAAWLNALQEELLTVIEAAGIAPDRADHGQLLAAVGDLVDRRRAAHAGLRQVDDLQALAALPPSETPDGVVLALGARTAGDGGGGLFLWDPVATGPADGALSVALPGAGKADAAGRYRRLDQGGPLDPRMFGARGDGRADDAAALQAGLDAAAASGRPLAIPPGRFLVAGRSRDYALRIAAGVRLHGVNPARSVIALAPETARDCVILGGIDAAGVTIEDLGFDGGGVDGRDDPEGGGFHGLNGAITLLGCSEARVRGCRIRHTSGTAIRIAIDRRGFGAAEDAAGEGAGRGRGVRIENNDVSDHYGAPAIVTKHGGVDDLFITGNLVRDFAATAISVEAQEGTRRGLPPAARAVISGNIVTGSDVRRSGRDPEGRRATRLVVSFGIVVSENVARVIVANNVVDGLRGATTAAGIMVGTSPGQDDAAVDQILVQANHIADIAVSGGPARGILVVSGVRDVNAMTICANTVRNAGRAIEIVAIGRKGGGGVVRNLLIRGNQLRGGDSGVSATRTDGAAVNLVDVTVSDNIISDAAREGVAFAAAGAIITGNRVVDCGREGAFSGVRLAGTGLAVRGNTVSGSGGDGVWCADPAVVTGNVLRDNGRAGDPDHAAGLRVEGPWARVVDNVIGGEGAATQKWGVVVGAPDALVGVRENRLVGNAEAPVAVAGGVAGGAGAALMGMARADAADATGRFDAAGNQIR